LITCVVDYVIDAGKLEALGYAKYRSQFGVNRQFIEADRIRDESGCVLRYDRSFMRPMLEGEPSRPSE